MPSGTMVTAKHDCYKPSSTTDKDCYLDVTVFPLAEDMSNSEGLCGNFNGHKDDDDGDGSNEPVELIKRYK